MADAKQLRRIHRVRTLQVTLARAGEAEANARLDHEEQLQSRIRQLADAVAPAPGAATSLSAAAHFRERLHYSAAAATDRVRAAAAQVEHAAELTRGARQDQGAVEKLQERAVAAALHRELRALEEMGAVAKKRHGSC
jgi:flagellar protein FliJ